MMHKWSLRWKIALDAALIGIVATIAGAATTWLIMHYWELSAFDRRLASDAQELLREVKNFQGDGSPQSPRTREDLVPLALRDRLIQVRDASGRIIYSTPGLNEPINDDGSDSIHSRKIGKRGVRMGTFRQDGLTAYVGADAGEVNQIGRDILLGMVGAIPTVLLVVLVGGRWVARKAIQPVDAIRQAAAGITLQSLDKRFPVPAVDDEVAGLIDVLNTMLERLQASFEQSARFSAEASHQLKTPLAVLRADVEAMLHAENPSRAEVERAPEMLQQIHQLSSIAENLLLLARADSGRLELQKVHFDLGEVLDGICDDVRALAEAQHLTVETKIPAELPVFGDRRSISLILQNLMENAVKFNARNGSICIHAETSGGQVEVRIKNNGSPIPPHRIPHIFDRFCQGRLDNGSRGPGLGLSIASELTKAHGGSLELIRSDGAWTEFCLRVPCA